MSKSGPTRLFNTGFAVTAGAPPVTTSAATATRTSRPPTRITGLYARLRKSDFERLRTQLGVEPLRERLDDPLPDRRRVFVRQRPLRRLEDGGERDRLPPLADLSAPVHVERAQLPQVRAGRLARGGDQIARDDGLVHRKREILLDRRERDHVLVERHVGHPREQRVEVELEVAPAVSLTDVALGRQRRPPVPCRELRRNLKRPVERLDDALRPVEA